MHVHMYMKVSANVKMMQKNKHIKINSACLANSTLHNLRWDIKRNDRNDQQTTNC